MKNKGFQKFIKRLFDIIFSFVGLVLFLPFGIIIAILIKTTSKGPVFFNQERPGKDKVLFKVYKFRTMKEGSEIMIKGQEVTKEDPRVTGIGKFLRRLKLDEVPQLLNILKGDMSLIGPRPERIASLEDYDDFITKRLNVRPGLTGLAQVSGNVYIDLMKRYEYDVYYADNFSLWLDIKIFFRTIAVVLLGEKRYKDKPLVSLEEK